MCALSTKPRAVGRAGLARTQTAGRGSESSPDQVRSSPSNTDLLAFCRHSRFPSVPFCVRRRRRSKPRNLARRLGRVGDPLRPFGPYGTVLYSNYCIIVVLVGPLLYCTTALQRLPLCSLLYADVLTDTTRHLTLLLCNSVGPSPFASSLPLFGSFLSCIRHRLIPFRHVAVDQLTNSSTHPPIHPPSFNQPPSRPTRACWPLRPSQPALGIPASD